MTDSVASSRTGKRQGDEALTNKGRNTRARILASGRAVIEQHGYFDASVTEITKRSGVALGTFYRYFENKDVLFLELLEALVEDLYESVSGSWSKQDVMASLRTSSRRYLAAYYANRKLIAAMIQMAGAVPACAALWWSLRKRTYDRMERYIAAAPTDDPLDPGLTVVALGSMVEQFANYWYVEAERNGKPVPDVEQAADVVSRLWYRAIYANRPASTEFP